jgi:chemotaxis protein CheD
MILPERRREIVVGVGDLRTSVDPGAVIVTHALGSCVGVVLYDPCARIGGLLHAMLPSSADSGRFPPNPFMYVDTGFRRMVDRVATLGASRQHLVVKVAGGARIAGAGFEDPFDIGGRNVQALRKMLWSEGLLTTQMDVGGPVYRTIRLDMATGSVAVLTPVETRTL